MIMDYLIDKTKSASTNIRIKIMMTIIFSGGKYPRDICEIEEINITILLRQLCSFSYCKLGDMNCTLASNFLSPLVFTKYLLHISQGQ